MQRDVVEDRWRRGAAAQRVAQWIRNIFAKLAEDLRVAPPLTVCVLDMGGVVEAHT